VGNLAQVYGGRKMCMFFMRKPEGGRPLGKLNVDGNVIKKSDLQFIDGKAQTGLI
jgi:hypothetical protein